MDLNLDRLLILVNMFIVTTRFYHLCPVPHPTNRNIMRIGIPNIVTDYSKVNIWDTLYAFKKQNMDFNQGSLSILVDILITINRFYPHWPVPHPTYRNLMRIDTEELLVITKNHYLEGSTGLK